MTDDTYPHTDLARRRMLRCGAAFSLIGTLGLVIFPMFGWANLSETAVLGTIAGLAITAAVGTLLTIFSLQRSARP